MVNIKISSILLFCIIISLGFLIGFVFSNKDILLSDSISVTEKPSPYNHIPEKDIIVASDRVIIKVNDPRWATFADSNSMDPVFDIGANTIQIMPNKTKDIHVGDIISYKSKYAEGTIIHRVVEIGEDNDGWFAELKGDNNLLKDPGKIRFSQIKSLTIAIVY
tara:strand:+ start:2335 stop:2823 length:489 start_codon:yes stop_codon:yes gene_type:complete